MTVCGVLLVEYTWIRLKIVVAILISFHILCDGTDLTIELSEFLWVCGTARPDTRVVLADFPDW